MIPISTLNLLSISDNIDITELLNQVDQDVRLSQIKRVVMEQPTAYPRFSLDQGRLLYMGRLVISQSSLFITTLLRMYHDRPMGGHSGEFKTYKRVAADWHWIGMKRDIQKYVRNYQVCQMNKTQSLSPGGLLQPLPIPNKVWEEISMDFIEGYRFLRGMIPYLWLWTV